ncbi:four helix bundle protein [Orenia marismortui]|uniref:Four helix bundle protein n=1 Tax=Orenia marismortui TaxID=46469 RepID=A0A4R8HFZ6_9FIRM|nr:four helix bundle protein [Orenia marismortui]TDX58942.1 four helix bundle protein [Orenia marismortui]
MNSVAYKDNFKNLKLWQEAHKLVLEIYQITANFPKEERYGLTDQFRRAVVSIPNNIVEGKGRKTNKELLKFAYISRGSLEEVKYLLILSKDLGYIEDKSYNHLFKQTNLIGKLLNGFINAFK